MNVFQISLIQFARFREGGKQNQNKMIQILILSVLSNYPKSTVRFTCCIFCFCCSNAGENLQVVKIINRLLNLLDLLKFVKPNFINRFPCSHPLFHLCFAFWFFQSHQYIEL